MCLSNYVAMLRNFFQQSQKKDDFFHMAVALTKVLKKGFQKIVFYCLFKSQRTTDFGYAVPKLVEGITLSTSTGSVT